MVRKVNITKHLEMMGYSVTVDGPMHAISLTCDDGKIYATLATDMEIQTEDFIVERIVHQINELIINDVTRVDDKSKISSKPAG